MLRKLFGVCFGGSDHEEDPKTEVKITNVHGDDTHISVNRITKTEPGKHTHDEYKVNKATGEYKEYRGGDNSDDRSYNKNKK